MLIHFRENWPKVKYVKTRVNVNMIKKTSDFLINNCMGCYTCYNVCEFEAIEMRLTDDGFYKPFIIREKCQDCGACNKKCPVLHPDYVNTEEPKFFMGWSKDKNIRKMSSSGGIFSEIAIYILENGGLVYGAAWDNLLEVKHIKVDSINDLSLLRGSKYLQSKIGEVYKEIKELIENTTKNILFVGTPCQVAGIKKIIKNPRLITCDLVCHGVASYIPFKFFIESLEDKIFEVNFRDKITGWRKFSVTYRGMKRNISHVHYKDRFFVGYLKNYYLNEACYSCSFSKLPRQGDITLGDFWGIEKKYDLEDNGVSLIIVNSSMGMHVVDELIRKNRIELVEVDGRKAIEHNIRICSGYYERPQKRDYIIEEIKKKGFTEVAEKEIKIQNEALRLLGRFYGVAKSKLKKVIQYYLKGE